MALLFGFVILILRKGGKTHRKMGYAFLVLLSVVVSTGMFGVLIFGRNSFLLVITVTSAYYGYSGFTVARTKSNTLTLLDSSIAVLSLCVTGYFLYYIKQIGMIWSPVIIYATVGNLSLVILYDFLKPLFSKDRYKKIWLSEHIYKMIAAFSALLSAAVGTIFPNHKPYSQFGPSIFGTCLAIGFILYFWYLKKKKTKIHSS